MCGIAGMVDLMGQRVPPRPVLEQMAAALYHRGPDEEGYFVGPAIGLAARRLSIVGLADGQQPIFNESGQVVTIFNGELYDDADTRAALEAKGHRFRTHTDTELLVHLWEEHGPELPLHLRGQFAFALADLERRTVLFARDRVGICPLYFAEADGWLLFASEIKAILASGLHLAELDPQGLDHVLTFFAFPTERTPFRGIEMLLPGWRQRVVLGQEGTRAQVRRERYWDFNFPDRGSEREPAGLSQAIDEFAGQFDRAVRRRLRADVPVVSYLSGGVDSATVLAAASRLHGRPLPAFTVRIPAAGLDESAAAQRIADQVGSPLTVISGDSESLAEMYPKVILAADTPVTDVTGGALHRLAAEVHRQGFKVALTGEGADEALAGYAWFRGRKAIDLLDLPGLPLGRMTRRLLARVMAPTLPLQRFLRNHELSGGSAALRGLSSRSSSVRDRLYSADHWDRLGSYEAFSELPLDRDQMRRWHPLNQSLYFTYKTLLAGLLLQARGDRAAMAHSVETRYPFLDEDLIDWCASIHPRWKLRGLTRNKYILRSYARTLLPAAMARQPKAMFRAPSGPTLFSQPPAYVRQLLAPESLRRTGLFDPERVQAELASLQQRWRLSGRRLNVEMGLAGVVATQLWHHLYLGGGLCDLPEWSPPTARPAPLPASDH